MKQVTVGAAVIMALIVSSCSGPKTMQSVDTGDIPSWFTDVPNDEDYLYAVNTATSQDLQVAIDKAKTGATADMARQTEARVEGLQKRFDEEVGIAQDAQLLQQFSQVSKTVVSTTLNGLRTKEQKTVQDGSMWRAYVLLEYPIGAMNQALVEQLKSNQQLYTRFRSSQTFEELDNEVKKYEEWKKSQQ